MPVGLRCCHGVTMVKGDIASASTSLNDFILRFSTVSCSTDLHGIGQAMDFYQPCGKVSSQGEKGVFTIFNRLARAEDLQEVQMGVLCSDVRLGHALLTLVALA